MKDYIKLLRPHHYIKNFLLFLPLIFSNNMLNTPRLVSSLIGFLIFSLSSSIVYIVNDIRDREKDRLHEIKKNRPIAANKISVSSAIIFAIVLFIIVSVLQFCLGKETLLSFLYILVYILINFAYSFGLKDIPILDVTIVVICFLLRVLYGASIINVEVSNWLYLTVMSLSFYLSLGKRRNEIIKSGTRGRKVLHYYNKEFLDKNMYMFLSISVVFYSLWCINDSYMITSNLLVWSIPFVVLILMKYSITIENDSFGDPVDVILKDKVLIILILSYGIYMFLTMYILK